MFNDGWNFEYVKQKYFWSSNKMNNIKKYHKGSITVHWYDDCKKTIKNVYTCKDKTSINQLNKRYKINFKICRNC